jgi:hypothetical protein
MIDIIDIVDVGNIGRELCVIPSKIERVLMVRAQNHHGGIYALGVLPRKSKGVPDRRPKAVLFELGRMSCGGVGGRHYLDEFRNWLTAEGLVGKLDPTLCHTPPGVYERARDSEEFDPGGCVGAPDEDARLDERLFAAWRRGDPDWHRV